MGRQADRIAAIWLTGLGAAVLTGPISRADDLQEVVVTGSHVIRDPEESTSPLTILDRAELERGTPRSVGEILQALPQQNGPTENLNNNDGIGATRINLRGMGPERTLVLLNGRRFIFGGLGADSSVNLDMIPLSMVERVEISTSGATSIYGSDAIAGVVNIITRRDFTGAEAQVSYGVSGHSDGAARSALALIGTGWARGNFVLGVQYDRQDAVLQSARDYSAHVESLVSPDGPVIHTGALNSADGLFVVPEPNALDPAGLGSGLYTHVAGATGHGPDAYRPWDYPADLYDYAPFAYLQTPSERGVAWLSVRYDFGGTSEFFAEALVHRGQTQERFSPATYSSFNNGAAPFDPATQTQLTPADNFYNPFGTDVAGVLSTLQTSVPRTFDERAATNRAVAGLRGHIGEWHWEGAVTSALSETREFQSGQILRAEVRNAVGASGLDSSGHVVCGEPDETTGIVPQTSIIRGCIPLDLFDGPPGITPQQLAYISRTLRNVGTNRHWVADFSLSGAMGHLPAGEMGWAFGAQYRRESASLVLDPQIGEGVTGSVLTSVPNPSVFRAREVFAELRAPLLRKLPASEALDATVGARYSRYSAFGSANSLQEGLHWRVTPHVTVRGGYSRVFRAPGLGDLFNSQFTEARPIDDPCGQDPTPEQQSHCAAAGVPGGRYQQRPLEPLQTVFGGNPGLDAESGGTWSAGVLLQSADVAKWAATVDYWHISLSNALGTPAPNDIVNECANSGAPDACALITRLPDGSISQIDAREHNLTQQIARGVDVSLRAREPIGAATLSVQLRATWLESETMRNFATGARSEVAGTVDANSTSWPRRRVSGALDWDRPAWRLSYIVHYIDSLVECGDTKNFFPFLLPTDCRKVASRIYHDVSLRYGLLSGLTATATLYNVLDTNPPRINQSTSANTDPALYPPLGRTYAIAIGYRFH